MCQVNLYVLLFLFRYWHSCFFKLFTLDMISLYQKCNVKNSNVSFVFIFKESSSWVFFMFCNNFATFVRLIVMLKSPMGIYFRLKLTVLVAFSKKKLLIIEHLLQLIFNYECYITNYHWYLI